MGSEGSSSSSSSDSAASVNEYIQDKKIVSCSLGLSKLGEATIKSFFGNMLAGKNYVHSALWLSDKNFDNTNEKGLIIEYGYYEQEKEIEYIPDNGIQKQKVVDKKNVIYHYKEKGGLRYYVKDYADYKKIFATIAYVDLDIPVENQMMFQDFINIIAPVQDNEWILKNYNFRTKNCQHFCAYALKQLKPLFRLRDIIINDKKNATQKRDSIIPDCILETLNSNK